MAIRRHGKEPLRFYLKDLEDEELAKALKGHWLEFERLEVRDKIAYEPLILEPYERFEKLKKGYEQMTMELATAALEGEVDEETMRKLSPQDKADLGAYLFQQAMAENPAFQQMGIRVTINREAVLRLFEKKLRNWSEGLYVDENDNPIPFSEEVIPDFIEDLDVERVILPAVIWLLRQCRMNVNVKKNTKRSRGTSHKGTH